MHRPPRLARLVALAAVPLAFALVAAAAAPTSASADMFVSAGAGPTIQLDHWPTQARLEQQIGYSFGGKRGFFISFAPSQSFLRSFYVLAFPIGLGGMFDVVRNADFTFQLGPMGTAGFAFSDDTNDRVELDPWFHFSATLILRFLFADERFGFYVKPAGFEFAVGDSRRAHGDFEARFFLAGGIHLFF